MASQRNARLRSLSRATGIPFRELSTLYKGRPDALAKAARAKSPTRSVSLTRYWQRVREINAKLAVPNLRVARMFWRTVDRVDPAKFRALTFDADKPPADVRGLPWKSVGHVLRGGPNRGKTRVYLDADRNRLLDKSTFQRSRAELRHQRMANLITGAQWGSYRRLHKFFSPSELKAIRARKVKAPTLAEARRAAKRMAKAFARDQGLYQYFVERVGYE